MLHACIGLVSDMNVLPLLTTIVAFAFTASLARQYLQRKKFHQVLWTVAMLFYGIAALMEFLMNTDVLGPSIVAFRIYYILSAPLVGLLGAGVIYLLASKRKADIFLAIIGLLSIALLITGTITPLDKKVIIEAFNGPLGEAFRAAVDAYPMTVRRYAIITNIIGGLALILGALYSFFKDRRRTYNILIFLGGLMPMIGGSALAFFNEPSLFFIFELGGTIFLYLGFIYSDRFIKDRETKIADALSKRENK
jgi:predicted membrane channel-forming protein YqfA (hemolysin III family)